jgi:hypothetical protein
MESLTRKVLTEKSERLLVSTFYPLLVQADGKITITEERFENIEYVYKELIVKNHIISFFDDYYIVLPLGLLKKDECTILKRHV